MEMMVYTRKFLKKFLLLLLLLFFFPLHLLLRRISIWFWIKFSQVPTTSIQPDSLLTPTSPFPKPLPPPPCPEAKSLRVINEQTPLTTATPIFIAKGGKPFLDSLAPACHAGWNVIYHLLSPPRSLLPDRPPRAAPTATGFRTLGTIQHIQEPLHARKCCQTRRRLCHRCMDHFGSEGIMETANPAKQKEERNWPNRVSPSTPGRNGNHHFSGKPQGGGEGGNKSLLVPVREPWRWSRDPEAR